MYGVLYAVTPELFPTKDRGTGNALVAAAKGIFGIMVSFFFHLPLFFLLFFPILWCDVTLTAIPSGSLVRRFDDVCAYFYSRRDIYWGGACGAVVAV